ncbi:helix-turn-helix domain-containing protein [Streptomyces sp. BE133]|uniref:helix-turn-helix domain-containing protein n=1 Tax=Streptomyces sp. BE133 TaxID=3002523 RepID=UPI002E7A5F7F|nr:helix-turn-helix domain-containing protein [Streptomyces sp. BE133]MEE1806702.1 helix-turn-helix domain-containing protein [Streptomyces sp. BE133]
MDTVRTWRGRFARGGLAALADRKRSGRPPSFTALQAAEVKALACRPMMRALCPRPSGQSGLRHRQTGQQTAEVRTPPEDWCTYLCTPWCSQRSTPTLGIAHTSIAARTAHRSGRPHEDLLAALGQLTDGTITHHQVNWISPLKERTTVVTGDHGILVADTLTADLSYWANGSTRTQWEALTAFRGVTEGDVTRYATPKREPLIAEHEAFRDLVLGHSQRTATLHDGLHAVLVANAALQASRTGTTAAVPTPGQVHHP